MDSFSIGLSGLTASQRAMDIIGNNIANAATEGYHRQRIELRAAPVHIAGSSISGGGVEVENTMRMVDILLEEELLRQNSTLEQTSRELSTLNAIEAAISDLDSGGLSSKIDEFFGALQDLSVHSTEKIYQQQVVTAANAMAGQFRTFGNYFDNLGVELTSEAQLTVQQINTIVAEIAKLNGSIEDIEMSGMQAGNLRDSRDKYISDLAQLIRIQTIGRDGGSVDVSFNGMALVNGRSCGSLEVKLQGDGKLGISIAGDDNYQTDIEGGKLGGVFALKNELVPAIEDKINNLAKSIITEINNQHVQGIGATGSFEDLTGWQMLDQDLANFDPPVENGRIYIRVTDESTGLITRQYIDVDTSQTLSDVAASFDALDNISASVIQGKLHIETESGYKFDFVPGVLAQPDTSTLTGTAQPQFSGLYTGTLNQTYTCTVSGTGQTGVTEGLMVEVRNESGDLVQTLKLGTGYVPGSKILIEEGVYASFSGTLNDGEDFTFTALADSDTSDLLASAGINAFFRGNNAATITINEVIYADPSKIATSLSNQTGNENVARMAKLASQSWNSLNNTSSSDYYKSIVATLGQRIGISQTHEQSVTGLIQNLQNQQDNISGVNVNEEAAHLIVYQRMFQAVGKYMQIVNNSLDELMKIM